MARFSSSPALVQAIRDGVCEMRKQHAEDGQFDGHSLINWLDEHRNAQLNEIYDLYDDCKDPEMTADQQLGKFLYTLDQRKIGERISPRRITRRGGYHRNGTCKVSIWAVSAATAVIQPAWLEGAHGRNVSEMARAIARDRTFGDLPVLADALGEAGCDDAVLLDFLRRPASEDHQDPTVVERLLNEIVRITRYTPAGRRFGWLQMA